MSLFPKPEFAREEIEKAKAHAVSCWPKESCGLIVGGLYVECENVSLDPENSFVMKASCIVDAGSALQAVIHSHPRGGRSPTAMDMRAQLDTGCIFGIIPCSQYEAAEPVYWGDFILDQPLIGREFIHGVLDCYSLIRSYFWQTKGLKLPDVARDTEWWDDGENLYLDMFQSLGFRVIDKKDVVVGDGFIGRVRSPVPNHGGIILERGLALHHLDGRLSRREPILRWEKFVTHYLRYEGGA